MYTRGAAGCWQGPTWLRQQPLSPRSNHHCPQQAECWAGAQAHSWSPASPGLRVCSRDGQERWPGEVAQPCLLSEAARPGRDLLPAALPLQLSFHLPCAYSQAPAVLSPARPVCPHGRPSLSSHAHPYPACTTSRACCHPHLPLLAGTGPSAPCLLLQLLRDGSGMLGSPAEGLAHSSTGQGIQRHRCPEDRSTRFHSVLSAAGVGDASTTL